MTENDQRKWLDKADKEITLQRQGKKTRLGTSSKILKGDKGPFEDFRWSFWESDEISRSDVSDWEKAMDLIALSSSEENRRCLWAWSRSKAGVLYCQTVTKTGKVKTGNVSFAKWCKLEGIHEETGRRRKDRAIAIIKQRVERGVTPDDESWRLDLLPLGPVFEHISDTVGAGSESEEGLRHRMEDGAFAPFIEPSESAFSWADARNERRRQKYAERQKAA
ncbi:hypothetical protein H9643_18915 [Ochrobactrum sp. Sa2BUA5]|nr:hypothetical protein [Ochrobactrum gallinarum]